MSRAVSLVFSRALLHAAIVAFAFCALPVAAAQAKVKVNCNLPGETISGALLLNVDVTPLVIQVKGTCTENIVIARDDVTIKTLLARGAVIALPVSNRMTRNGQTTTIAMTRVSAAVVAQPAVETRLPLATQVIMVLLDQQDPTAAVTGDLTVRDVTRPVTLNVEFEGANASPFGDQRVAFSASTDIDREDWGLTWNVALETGGVLVGKQVRIELNVQAVKQ